jgi:nucleoside-diphosphate-sugar epimerase
LNAQRVHVSEGRIAMTRRKAFVFGATGFGGRFVVQQLCAAGVATTAHVRPDSPDRARWIEYFAKMGAAVDTTAWTPEALAPRLQTLGPELVFSLLGTTAKRARREGLQAPYMRVCYGLTAMAIDAAATLPRRPLFVYVSAAGVGSAVQGGNAYLSARVQAEAHLRQSGLPYLIARPGLFTGERDEPRPAERAFGLVLPPIAAVLRLVGARHLAAQAQPMTGQQLAGALVKQALAGGANRVLEAMDLQA